MSASTRRAILSTVVAIAANVLLVSTVWAQMDLTKVAGVPLPVGDLPAGTIVVRVVRGTLSNNIPDQQVELVGVEPGRSVKTDASGRAQFEGLKPGTRVTAVATVSGERLQSQEITVPPSGGFRVLLVATDPNATAGTAAAPPSGAAGAPQPGGAAAPQPGAVVLGEQSRFVFELGDGSLSVFNIFEIVNPTSTPVQPKQLVVFETPQGATGTSLLGEASSPQAKADGRRVTVAGPFAPGATVVQFGYSMPYSSGDLTIEQTMPIPLSRVIALAQKASDTRLQSPQLTEQREMTAEGQNYIVGQGPAVGSGGVVTFNFSGLPHEARWPRFVALGLAIVILGVGGWLAFRSTPVPEDKGRARLETKRNQLFAELTSIEEQHRDGRVDPQRYETRRQELITALERIYAEIDRRAA
jgi:hypothetical protein